MKNNMLLSVDFSPVIAPILEVLNAILWPAIALVGAIGTIYCIVLGVKYAKAEDPQEHEKAKGALKNAIIGFVLIFILIVMLQFGLEAFMDYLGYDSESWNAWFFD